MPIVFLVSGLSTIDDQGLPSRVRVKWEWPEKAIDALAVSPDGKLLATAKEKVITLWGLNTGKQVATLEGPTLPVTRLMFAPNGAVLASAADVGDFGPRDVVEKPPDVEVKVWDLATAVGRATGVRPAPQGGRGSAPEAKAGGGVARGAVHRVAPSGEKR